ncbi:permease-like cell division protein FtsX [Neisseria leonii]|uniref:Cell division protein FtsX n=1 Tax=Neisseria leonii TaxID=2995413 RepID=A0A9X4IDM1_9NEIS|nr:permease-like cell division protein FtsX [Neisseria sp. 51.81]MDD9327836.1 permease-like cell division protein FtsX [Neisseria sp. 51.81]
MNAYLRLHLDAAKNAARHWLRQPVAALLILAMLAVAMMLPLALYLGVQSSQAVLGRLNESPQMTLYMESSADEVDGRAVAALLEADGRIAAQRFVGKAEGLAELQQSMDGQDWVSVLDDNPLPDVFVVSPKDNLAPDEMQALQVHLAQLPMVESVKLDTEWMQTLYQINDLVKKVLWFLALTLSVAFVLVAHNTIRLQILSRKEEIEITKLLGAPASFIRRPFLYQAAWQSLAAAGVSLLLCGWLVRATRPLVAQIFQPYGLNLQWRFFTFGETVLVLLVVSGLGIGGAWLAAQQHLLSFKAKK